MYDFSLFGAIRFTSAVAAKFHVVQTDVSYGTLQVFMRSDSRVGSYMMSMRIATLRFVGNFLVLESCLMKMKFYINLFYV